jgi:glycosyltransferase involved in cell wall biosynthesis
MGKLKVAVDDTPLHTGHAVRGMGFYTKNLIEALKRNKEIDLVSRSEKHDILHIPYFDLFANTLHIDQKQKTVVTVPDVIPLLYPKVYKPGMKGMLNLFLQKRALQKADAVVTISETSKKDIVRLLNVPAEKIHVAYLGPGNNKTESIAKLKLPKNYVLYSGDINWNKNINVFLKAIETLKVHTIIIGKQAKELLDDPAAFDFSHPQLQHLEETRKLLQNTELVTVKGYVEEAEFNALFKNATVYCQPSLYEGFGLPLLEAMQNEIPIVAARTQALVEVADDAALYFDSLSVKDLAEKLQTVMNDSGLRRELVRKGSERLKNFSWEHTARNMVQVYKHVE